ncbi:WD repeat-containing protein 1, partial [Pteropus alecto]|uniref:WD repeat-containing protein 1 n=1 Tax=Pteropus alecto TaxID=9402 RepID=UPI000D535092
PAETGPGSLLSFFSSIPSSARRGTEAGTAPNVPRRVCVSAEKVFASLPQVERGVSKIIGGDPTGNTFIYTNGKCVIIRNINYPALADIYTEHAHQVVVAKYAPSGFYIASGDVSGKLRIWDTTQVEHLLKYEYQPFAGKIKDIAWTEDSKRIAVVGEGREKFGAVFLWDSGSSVGEITGHNKIINSVDIRQSRPYRLVTGSDDNCAAFFEGPPFKFKFTIGDHSRFVNCVRFSPDGNRFATASADGQIYIYDGKTGEKVCALGGGKAHDGGVYAISWSPDSTHLLSASGDKTSKVWDVSANSVVNTFTMGSNILDQQLGCLWQNDHLLSISLSGYINYLDKNNPSKPLRVIKGHSKSIQCLTVHRNGGKSYIYSGSHDGHINYWDSETGENDSFAGKGHTNQVSRMTVDESGQLVSCSMDDTVRYTSVTLRDYRKKCFSIDSPGYEPEVVAVHPSGDMVAVGGTDGNVRLYSILGTTLKDEGKLLEAKGPVTDLAYSHDGAFLAVCDASKVVTVFSVADGYSENNVFYGHHAKIVCLAWSPDNEHFASGGMDMMVYVWTLSDPETRVKIQDAHRLHHVSSLAWLDEHTLVTTSHDASVKEWTITY